MSHSRTTKPLWLIQPCLDAGEYRDKLIGSVVKHPDLPTEKRIPYKTQKLPREMVTDLDPKPVQVRNLKFWQRRIKDANVSASLHDILEGFVERAKEDSHERCATVARLWHMDSPGEKFKELLKDKQYFEELFNLLKEAPEQQAYFITDIVTLVNMELVDEKGNTKGAGASVNVPFFDPTTGTPLNSGASARMSVVRESGRAATYEEETIVFLGYRLVRLDKIAGIRAKLGRAVYGQTNGFTIRDGFEYWPRLYERPVEGNTEAFMSPVTPKAEENKQLGHGEAEAEQEMDEIAELLGFDVEVVGYVDES